MLSLVVGVTRMVLEYSFVAPLCGSGEEDSRLSIVKKVDFLHFAAILSVFSVIVMVIISLCTKPRPPQKVFISLNPYH